MKLNKLLYQVYNIKSGGALKQIYSEVIRRNQSMLPYQMDEVASYLKHWGFNETLEKNPLMTKEDIIAWREKTKADKSAKTFSFTGGSTGQPLKIPLSKKRDLARKALLLFYNSLVGYGLGSKYLFIRVKNRPWFLRKLRNEFVFIPKNLSEEVIFSVIQTIQKKEIKFIFGHPSVIFEIASGLLKKNISAKTIKGIICTSEPLHFHQLEVIKTAFQCPVLDRYSNEEVGVIAHQRSTGGDLLVDRFGVFVEVLDPFTLQPVSTGQEGKVVVTDLNADLVPIIRYDTGDTAIVSEYRNGQLFSLKQVLGRQIERIFKPDGSPVSSLSLGPGIYKPFSNKGYTCYFQFAQTGKNDYELRIKENQEKIESAVIDKVLENITEILGSEAEVNVLFVENLKVRKSGKVPIYLNEYHP